MNVVTVDPRQLVTQAHTVVVKVGTRSLTLPDGKLDPVQVAGLADQLADLRASGRRVVLVSSGAVGAGIGRLGLGRRPADLAELQAVAAVGQTSMIEAYNRALERHKLHAAQVLLTADDFGDRHRYLNVRNTLFALFQLPTIPIINENDTVRVEELQRNFGDNDRLAAMVTNLLRAPLLILLSDVDGVLTPTEPRQVVPLLNLSAGEAGGLAYKDERTGIRLSTGGMASKLEAARIVTTAGERVVIANGRQPGILAAVLAGEPVGTLLMGEGTAVSSRKRWLGWASRSLGKLQLDDGACRAVVERGSSLLAVGVRGVDGNFSKGDVVSLLDPSGRELARGLTNYSADELRQIAGQPAERIETILGYAPYQEVVHRDHLALVESRRRN